MFPASTKGGGICVGQPDVCKIPPLAIPTPFTNTGMCANAIPATTAVTVLICGQPALHVLSVIASTSGDEPGTLLGVKSGMVKGPQIYKTASATVFVQGSPIVTALKVTGHNGVAANVPGMQVAPSQVTVFVGA
jgi:hypothetical protein